MTAILIYATDPLHSYASRELIGAATTENKRDAIVRKFLREYLHFTPTRDEIADAVAQIREMDQTQCLADCYDLEIDTDTISLNEIVYG